MSFTYDAPLEYDSPQPYDFSGSFQQPLTIPVPLPHLSAVLTLQGDGTFNFWQQGTIDEVSQSVEMICGTVQGQRTVVPGFGIIQQAFLTTTSANEILGAINLWEPRANVSVNASINDQGIESVQVNTSLRQGSTS
jgi:phage baseplate assembly protein W